MQAIVIGLIAALGAFDYQLGTLYMFRPIVLGPLVGLVLGDLKQGLIVGANLELLFMGSISVGAYIPPDVIVGGVLATAFAIATGKGAEAAIAIALPIALLSLALGNINDAVVAPLILRIADKSAKKGEIKGVSFAHYLIGSLNCLRDFILVFLAFKLGVNKMEIFLNSVPDVLIDGMAAAAGLLPALGFAMLMRMILNRQLKPYYFLGFVLAAYLNVPVLGVAILGLIIVLIKFDFLNPNTAHENEGGTEDDDF
jgi:fructoselysine and glucoselysine-specific PTS system IIC component